MTTASSEGHIDPESADTAVRLSLGESAIWSLNARDNYLLPEALRCRHAIPCSNLCMVTDCELLLGRTESGWS